MGVYLKYSRTAANQDLTQRGDRFEVARLVLLSDIELKYGF